MSSAYYVKIECVAHLFEFDEVDLNPLPSYLELLLYFRREQSISHITLRIGYHHCS